MKFQMTIIFIDAIFLINSWILLKWSRKIFLTRVLELNERKTNSHHESKAVMIQTRWFFSNDSKAKNGQLQKNRMSRIRVNTSHHHSSFNHLHHYYIPQKSKLTRQANYFHQSVDRKNIFMYNVKSCNYLLSIAHFKLRLRLD